MHPRTSSKTGFGTAEPCRAALLQPSISIEKLRRPTHVTWRIVAWCTVHTIAKWDMGDAKVEERKTALDKDVSMFNVPGVWQVDSVLCTLYSQSATRTLLTRPFPERRNGSSNFPVVPGRTWEREPGALASCATGGSPSQPFAFFFRPSSRSVSTKRRTTLTFMKGPTQGDVGSGYEEFKKKKASSMTKSLRIKTFGIRR